MKGIAYGARRLVTEYKTMHKPDRHTLVKDTVRITGSAIILAVILKMTDMVFAALLGLLL